MLIAYAIVAVVESVMLCVSARNKLTSDPHTVELIGDVVGVPLRWFPALAGLQLAGAAGLLVGIGVPAIGVAAALGLVLFFVCAVIAHLRVRDLALAHNAPALLMLVMSSGALILRVIA